MKALALGLILLAARGLADTVTLRDGRVIEGSFAGGDERQVRIKSGDKVETFEVSAVARIEFSAPAPPPPAVSPATLNGLAALVAIVAAAPNVDKAPEHIPNPFLTLPAASQPKPK